jgi:hypothetical protein
MPERADLVERLAEHVGVPPLTEPEIDSVLALAGAAAHGTGDRTNAPLVSFLAGVAAAESGDRLASLSDLRRRTAELAPPVD